MTDERVTSILSVAVSAAFAELQREIADLKRRVQCLEERGGGERGCATNSDRKSSDALTDTFDSSRGPTDVPVRHPNLPGELRVVGPGATLPTLGIVDREHGCIERAAAQRMAAAQSAWRPTG